MTDHHSLTPDNCPDCGHPHPSGPCLAWADVDAEATYKAIPACEECGADLRRFYEPGYTSTLCPSCGCTGGCEDAAEECLVCWRG